MCTFLFWMENCGIWNRSILEFVKLVHCAWKCLSTQNRHCFIKASLFVNGFEFVHFDQTTVIEIVLEISIVHSLINQHSRFNEYILRWTFLSGQVFSSLLCGFRCFFLFHTNPTLKYHFTGMGETSLKVSLIWIGKWTPNHVLRLCASAYTGVSELVIIGPGNGLSTRR